MPLVHGDPITQPVFGGSAPAPPSFQSPDIMMMQPQYQQQQQQQQQPMYGGGVQQPVFDPKWVLFRFKPILSCEKIKWGLSYFYENICLVLN